MQVNLTKTWERLLRGKTTRTPPEPLEIIGRKEDPNFLIYESTVLYDKRSGQPQECLPL